MRSEGCETSRLVPVSRSRPSQRPRRSLPARARAAGRERATRRMARSSACTRPIVASCCPADCRPATCGNTNEVMATTAATVLLAMLTHRAYRPAIAGEPRAATSIRSPWLTKRPCRLGREHARRRSAHPRSVVEAQSELAHSSRSAATHRNQRSRRRGPRSSTRDRARRCSPAAHPVAATPRRRPKAPPSPMSARSRSGPAPERPAPRSPGISAARLSAIQTAHAFTSSVPRARPRVSSKPRVSLTGPAAAQTALPRAKPMTSKATNSVNSVVPASTGPT